MNRIKILSLLICKMAVELLMLPNLFVPKSPLLGRKTPLFRGVVLFVIKLLYNYSISEYYFIYIWLIIASANPEELTQVAPCIKRSKS